MKQIIDLFEMANFLSNRSSVNHGIAASIRIELNPQNQHWEASASWSNGFLIKQSNIDINKCINMLMVQLKTLANLPV